jgi:peptidyl-prolyl cis-trans isomerase B (cyclophilin B)
VWRTPHHTDLEETAVASTKTRQRKLERERYERKLVRLAQQQRRKRQIQAGIGAFVALALVGFGVAWLAGVFDPDPPEPVESHRCTWLPRDPAEHPDRVDVGVPPQDPPESGARTIAVDLDAGETATGQVVVNSDVAVDPCGAASMQHLASQGFFNDTVCHSLDPELGALRCGSPNGNDLGGPSYSFWAENLPILAAGEEGEPAVSYPAGTMAFADAAGENGSQFLIFYQDYAPENPTLPIIGTVSEGLDVVESIAEAGVDEGTTTPVEEVRIRTLTVADAGAAPVQ